MADPHAGIGAGPRAFHVDRDGLADAARGDRPDEVAVAAHLLGHGEHLQAGRVGRLPDGAGILGHRVEVDHRAVGRQRTGLVKRDRRLDQGRVAASQDVEKHRCLLPLIGAARARSAPPPRG